MTITKSLTEAISQGAGIPIGGIFNCGRLTYVSGTAVKFAPFNGDLIKINGSLYKIPSAGIAGVTSTSVFVNGVGVQNLAASTLYYVYAFINSGVITADFMTTAHVTSTTTGNVGIEIMSGDDTRTLIGMVYTNGSSQFQQSSSVVGVLSWFNRQGQTVAAGISNGTTTSTSMYSFGIYFYMLNWAGEPTSVTALCWCSPSASYAYTGVGLDGTTVFGAPAISYAGTCVSVGGFAVLSEGLHSYGLIGCIPSTGTYTQLNNSATGYTRG